MKMHKVVVDGACPLDLPRLLSDPRDLALGGAEQSAGSGKGTALGGRIVVVRFREKAQFNPFRFPVLLQRAIRDVEVADPHFVELTAFCQAGRKDYKLHPRNSG